MRVSQSIDNLIGGVSQQGEAIRRPTQTELQNNAYPSLVEGNSKRPPAEFLAKLYDGTLGPSYHHTINREDGHYKVVITDGDLFVVDMDTGSEVTVAFPDGKGYLSASSPRQDFHAITVSDSTFILNKTVATAMSASTSADPGPQAVVDVQAGNYATTYEIEIDGTVEASVKTSETDVNETDTTWIAEELQDQLETALGTGWTIDISGSTLWIRKDDASDFAVKATDSMGNTNIVAVKDTVQRFALLPTVAPADMVVQVMGDDLSRFDDYYVKFRPNNSSSSFDSGVWEETVAPGISDELDATTMPHRLIEETDGTFTFEQLTWEKRKAGDDDSAPVPSFVGYKLADVFFHKDRLGLLAQGNAVLSRASEYFSFFRDTVTTLLDTDPIDSAVSRSETLIYAAPYRRNLLMFTRRTQHILQGSDILSPKTVETPQTTTYEASTTCRPASSGANLFFGYPTGRFSGVREYLATEVTDEDDAANIAKHVPKYIEGSIIKMTVSTAEDVLCVLTDDTPKAVYVYNFYWSGNEKLQSAWHRFTFDGDVLDIEFIQSALYITIQRSDGVYVEMIQLDPGRQDAGTTYVTHLDRRIDESSVTATYDGNTDQTTFELPYEPNEDNVVVVTRTDDDEIPGVQIDIEDVTGDEITVNGDHSSTPVFIGEVFEYRYRLPRPFLRENRGGQSSAAVAGGRLQVQKYLLRYDRSGYFEAHVTTNNRDTHVIPFTGRQLGTGSAAIGEVRLNSGVMTIPVRSRNDRLTVDLVSKSYLPCRFLSAEWQARYINDVRRL